MTAARETVGGLWRLLILGVRTRFRFRGPYWTWRLYTALGAEEPPRRRELLRAVLHYARWMHRMRTFR